MSQMVTRKRTGGDEKEKRTDSPVKDMKKKMAANAEKEKNAVENKSDKPEKPADKPSDKPADKPADKTADKSNDKVAEKAKPNDKPAEKAKPNDKPAEKAKPNDKPAEKAKTNDKTAEKPKTNDKFPEKTAEKKDANERKKEDVSNGESSNGKPEKEKKSDARKQNGSNGVNGTVSADSDSDDLIIDEADELFPELAYDDSDVEWEPSDAPSRSLTRRSQVKAARTPETPRPASGRPTPPDESKDSKVLKLNQEGKADAQKPETKKAEASAKKPETPSKETKTDAKKDEKEYSKAVAKSAESQKDKEGTKKDQEKSDKVEVEVVVEIESAEPDEESRKPDTNFSKSRVKVSPYRRSTRLADQTVSSVTANYTGNNTTMEMDITETSSMMEQSLDDSYLSGLRSIRGRRSYKPLKEITIRSVSANRSVLSNNSGIVSEQPPRPTGTVVGRKRKPDADVSLAVEAEEFPAASKRQRLLSRLSRPFRTVLLPTRRNAEIVGINTDLPLSAPVASTSSFDPEALKPDASSAPAAPPASSAPVAPVVADDAKRCVIV